MFKLYFNRQKIQNALQCTIIVERNLLLRDLITNSWDSTISILSEYARIVEVHQYLVPLSFSHSIFMGFHQNNSHAVATEFIDRFRGALQNNSASMPIKIRARSSSPLCVYFRKYHTGSSRTHDRRVARDSCTYALRSTCIDDSLFPFNWFSLAVPTKIVAPRVGLD